MDKDKWITEVMNSTQGMSPAQPPADLFDKITLKLNRPGNILSIPFPVKHWAAAAILLLALNVGSVFHFIAQTKKTTTAQIPLSVEMQTGATYNY